MRILLKGKASEIMEQLETLIKMEQEKQKFNN